MQEWLFLGAQLEDGVAFQCGQAQTAGGDSLYRWERLAGKPYSDEIIRLREAIGRRSAACRESTAEAGILPVTGPLGREDGYWLGWPLRRGVPLAVAAQQPPGSERWLTAVYPLIQSYARLHRANLPVGRPDWRRLRDDGTRLFMPDPWFQPYLIRPELDLPAGLEWCRPPEEYRGTDPAPGADLYYLGLLIYWFWTGRVPYELKGGWPTAALQRGEALPPAVFRAGLPAEPADAVLALLQPDPARRPGAAEVERIWSEAMDRQAIAALPLIGTAGRERAAIESYRRQCRIKRIRQLLPALAGALALGMLLIWLAGRPRPLPDPQGIARQFYEASRQTLSAAPSRDEEHWSGDFLKARQRRVALADAVLSEPIADLRGMRLVSHNDSRAVMEVRLRWREFTLAGWQFRNTVERLILEQRGRGWRIVSRKQLPD